MDALYDILVDIRRAAYSLREAYLYADEHPEDGCAHDDIDYRREYLDDSIARYLNLQS